MASRTKRRAAVPMAVRLVGNTISKADLLEVAWDLCGLVNDAGSAEDDVASLRALAHYVNRVRAAHDAPTVKLAQLADKFSKCGACKGKGKLPGTSADCPACKGTGKHGFDVSLLVAAAEKDHEG